MALQPLTVRRVTSAGGSGDERASCRRGGRG